MPHAHPPSESKHNLHRWELGLVGVAATAIAAPYMLPLLGIGDQVDVDNVIRTCSQTTGGLAQAIEGALSSVPGVGKYIGTAGWTSSITSGVIGIAGVLAGDYVHRHYDRKGHIQWGNVIKYVALTTSILIALPSILSGISMGITYIASMIGGSEGLLAAKNFLGPTIGFSGLPHTSPTGLAGLLPHLLTCGRALLPMGVAALFAKRSQTHGETPDSYSVRPLAPCIPLKGQPCEMAFQLVDTATGRPLEESELEVMHTRPLHTMIVDSSLRDYHHLHPEYDPARKCFVCRFTPGLQANYSMWNDFTAKGDAAPTHTHTALGAQRGLSVPARVSHSARATDGSIAASISSDGPLRAGQGGQMRIDLNGADGQPLTDFEPIMGAYAHLVAFSADGQHFIHAHPLGTEPQSHAERGMSPLYFHVSPEAAGAHQFFLQIQRGGRIHTLPFGQMVAQAREQTNHGATGAQRVNTIAGR